MGDFLGELAKQLAGRWLSLLAVPGALFAAAVWAGLRLGQAHALDAHRLAAATGEAAERAGRWPVPTQALALAGVPLTAAAVGLGVQALVGPVRALCLGQWPPGLRGLATVLTGRRRARWRELVRRRAKLEADHPRYGRTAGQQQRIDRLAGRINAIALAEPGRPTWMGDRVHALSEVSVNRYGLDLTFGWSRLWLVFPDTVRTEIEAAQSGFATAALGVTWSLPYLALGVRWWPAALAGAVVAAAGRSRARARIAALTEMAEAAVDVHGRALAIALGVADPTSAGPLTPDEGQRITDIARKGR